MGIRHVVLVVGLVVACAAHAEKPTDVTAEQLGRIEAWSVRDDGHCAGIGLDWSCDPPWPGLFRAHDAGVYEASLSETTVETGVQILGHLVGKARRGDDWAKYALDGYMRIAPFGDDGRLWHVAYDWIDQEQHAWASVIELRGSCRKDNCRFRSKFLTMYSLLR